MFLSRAKGYDMFVLFSFIVNTVYKQNEEARIQRLKD